MGTIEEYQHAESIDYIHFLLCLTIIVTYSMNLHFLRLLSENMFHW